jgi:hypothetical protein
LQTNASLKAFQGSMDTGFIDIPQARRDNTLRKYRGVL